MSGVWLVTGAGSGVGRALARDLAAQGAEVLLASRDEGRLTATAGLVRAAGGPAPQVLPVDLSEPAQVDALAAAVLRHLEGRPLAGLVHAAGVMRWSSPEGVGGWTQVAQVNALAAWALTRGLEGALLRAAGARVLFIAGAPFTFRGLRPDLGAWKGTHEGRGPTLALEAAAAKVVMARVLHRRWAGQAAALAFHPGFVRSRLAEGLPWPLRWVGTLAQPFLAARSASGAFAALDPAAAALSGTLVSGRHGVTDCPFPVDTTWEDAFAAALP